MIVNAKKLLEKAKKEGRAVGAFNTSTFEITKGILLAAEETKSPIIIETSEGEANFEGFGVFVDSVHNIASTMSVDVAINLDHGKSIETAKKAIEAGYTALHFDGSKLSNERNMEITREVVRVAHPRNISVEGELGVIGGSSEKHDKSEPDNKSVLTNPKEAIEFAKETGIDIFAGSYGNVHGIYGDEPNLDVERIREISKGTGLPLSLHGGSGIPENQVRDAIDAGIRKINVNTELRIAYGNSLHDELSRGQGIAPYKYLDKATEEVKKVVIKKIELFNNK